MRKAALTLLLTGWAGCAHTTSDEALTDVRQKLVESQRKEADERRRIEELENRVFLMNDRLESEKVASAAPRAPRLPVVTLRPTENVPPETAVEEEQPEFTGAARTQDERHVRTVLRGDGEAGVIESQPRVTRARRSEPSRSESRPPNARLVSQAGDDSLGVAPVPPIPKTPSTTRAPSLPAAERAERPPPPVDNAPLEAYRAAYAQVGAGRYDEAEQLLRAFVKRYPKHDYADNAQYWIGECYYARHQFREAAVEFRAVVAKYPVGNKAPDALLKLSYSLLALGERGEAQRLLQELPATYPRTEAARLSQQKLAELGTPISSEDRR